MNIQEILRTKWRFVHVRKRSPLFWYLVSKGTTFIKNDVGFDYILPAGTFADHIAFEEKNSERIETRIAKKLEEDPEFLLKIMKKGYEDRTNAIQQWKKMQSVDYAASNREKLAQALEAYEESLLLFGLYVVLPLMAESHMSETIHAELLKLFPKKANEYFNIATDPVKEGSVVEEKMALLRLAVQTKKGKDISVKLKQHCEDFRWMKNPGYFEEYYDESHYRKQLEELLAHEPEKELKEMELHQKEKEKKFNALLEMVKDKPALQSLIRTANEAVFFRSYRTEIYYSSPTYLTSLFKAIAKQLGLRDYRDVLYFYPFEINAMLRGNKKAPVQTVQERKKAYVCLVNTNGCFSLEGNAALELAAKLDLQGTHHHGDVIEGQSAFIGKVRGKAVVVHNLGELSKVKKGEILVTHATNVNFVPVLKLVVGIVTEEGGILSHASIISRELKIPAVIGTKNATKVLKDGDEIEVDSEIGTVTKIK